MYVHFDVYFHHIGLLLSYKGMCGYVCVCVCMRERKGKRERRSERERESLHMFIMTSFCEFELQYRYVHFDAYFHNIEHKGVCVFAIMRVFVYICVTENSHQGKGCSFHRKA